jgi:hypothetical protein
MPECFTSQAFDQVAQHGTPGQALGNHQAEPCAGSLIATIAKLETAAPQPLWAGHDDSEFTWLPETRRGAEYLIPGHFQITS